MRAPGDCLKWLDSADVSFLTAVMLTEETI
jgi:hypothetical protein